MSPSIDVHDNIVQAREMDRPPGAFVWTSFAEFFTSRMSDAALGDRTFLTYYDDARHVRRSYTYAEFGSQVERVAAFLRSRLGLVPGDRLATVLFNHDQTVVLYFAAWVLGVAVVPINVEESTEKKRYILEHSEAAAIFCWHDRRDETITLSATLPLIRAVIAVDDEGIGRSEGRETRGGRTTVLAAPFSRRASSL